MVKDTVKSPQAIRDYLNFLHGRRNEQNQLAGCAGCTLCNIHYIDGRHYKPEISSSISFRCRNNFGPGLILGYGTAELSELRTNRDIKLAYRGLIEQLSKRPIPENCPRTVEGV